MWCVVVGRSGAGFFPSSPLLRTLVMKEADDKGSFVVTSSDSADQGRMRDGATDLKSVKMMRRGNHPLVLPYSVEQNEFFCIPQWSLTSEL